MSVETSVADRQRPAATGVQQRLSALAALVTDIVLPPQCLACAAPVANDGALCPLCWSRLRLIEQPLCQRLGIPLDYDAGEDAVSPGALADSPPFDRCRSVAVFDDVSRRLVYRLKYGDQIELADWIGGWMARAAGPLIDDADLIMPIPLHRRRLWSRRYNQSALLATAIAKRAGHRSDMRALRRVRATRQQVGLSANARLRNVQGVFDVPDSSRNAVRDRRVLLVDDVYTTGATVKAAAQVLLRAGAEAVDVVVFARVVRDSDMTDI